MLTSSRCSLSTSSLNLCPSTQNACNSPIAILVCRLQRQRLHLPLANVRCRSVFFSSSMYTFSYSSLLHPVYIHLFVTHSALFPFDRTALFLGVMWYIHACFDCLSAVLAHYRQCWWLNSRLQIDCRKPFRQASAVTAVTVAAVVLLHRWDDDQTRRSSGKGGRGSNGIGRPMANVEACQYHALVVGAVPAGSASGTREFVCFVYLRGFCMRLCSQWCHDRLHTQCYRLCLFC